MPYEPSAWPDSRIADVDARASPIYKPQAVAANTFAAAVSSKFLVALAHIRQGRQL